MDFEKCIICFLVIFGYVFGEEGSLLKPCDVEDLDCLSKSTKQFLESTAKGIPQYDIKAIDPMVLPLVEVDLNGDKIKYSFNNLTVTGMKDLLIEHFTMNTEAKEVVLATKVDLKYNADITIQYDATPSPKSYTGTYSGSGKAIVTSTYNYVIKTNDKGVEHFDVGPEKNNCEPLEADGNLNEDLINQLRSDAEKNNIKKNIFESREESMKNGFCKLVTKIYPTVIHNLRAIAKILPKTAFFNNV